MNKKYVITLIYDLVCLADNPRFAKVFIRIMFDVRTIGCVLLRIFFVHYSTLLLVGSDSVQYKSEKFVLFDSCFILFMIIVN